MPGRTENIAVVKLGPQNYSQSCASFKNAICCFDAEIS